jgi:hypothetical protein
VELEADITERLKRNKSDFRLSKKPSKRRVSDSDAQLLLTEKQFRMNTDGDFFHKANYVKINNTNLSPQEAAIEIVKAFGLKIIDVD